MTDEKRQDFTRRICNANETELLLLVFEMTIAYIDDMIHEQKSGRISLQSYTHFENCIRHLENSVSFRDEIGQNLFQIYRFIEAEVSKAYVKKEENPLKHSKKLLGMLKESVYQLSKKDTSRPVIQNAEQVYVGLTYSGSGLDISSVGTSSNRGFLA